MHIWVPARVNSCFVDIVYIYLYIYSAHYYYYTHLGAISAHMGASRSLALYGSLLKYTHIYATYGVRCVRVANALRAPSGRVMLTGSETHILRRLCTRLI